MTKDTSTAPTMDVIDILTADHLEMLELLGEIAHRTDAGQRRDLADTLIAEVMRHAVAEEMFVYPAVQQHVPNGAEKVEHDKQEHQRIVEVMKQLEASDASDSRFMEYVQQLDAELRHHVKEEELDQFPQLRTHIPAEHLIRIGEQVENAKKLAPTRPHPSAPHSALFHKTLGAGVGMIDRLRDKLSGRHTG